jgi:hypothetical protein
MPAYRIKAVAGSHGFDVCSDPEADIIGERIETSLLSPGFHLEASCFLPVAAWV